MKPAGLFEGDKLGRNSNEDEYYPLSIPPHCSNTLATNTADSARRKNRMAYEAEAARTPNQEGADSASTDLTAYAATLNSLHALLQKEITPENQTMLNTQIAEHKVEIARLRVGIKRETSTPTCRHHQSRKETAHG